MTSPMPLSDSLVAPLLVALRDCLCAELQRSVLGPACRCMIVHNFTSPVMDGCDCICDEGGQGDAWVRLVRLEPELTADPVHRHSCPVGWQAVIELGTYRCVPTPEDGEEFLPLEERVVTDSALELLSDMNALLRVLACCPPLRDMDVGVEFWQPVGPAGGCAGGVLQIRVALSGGPGGC